MPGKKRTDNQIAADDVTISEYYLAGLSQAEIARRMKLSQPTISRAIDRIHQRWLESPLVNFDEAKRRELAAINRIESEAWEAWLVSKEVKTTRTTTGGKGIPTEATIKTEDQKGDPQFLTIMLKCSKQRSDLLGLIVTRSEAVAGEGGESIDSFSGMFRLIGEREKLG